MGALAKAVFVGHDSREADATKVCIASMLEESSSDLSIKKLSEPRLRHSGLYRRTYTMVDGVKIDTVDRKPFSTDFSFTRFLVPALSQYDGPALFSDGDFLFREDVTSLFALFDPRYAVQVVKHRPLHEAGKKMDGQSQQPYFRKNWSSLVLWNCGHASNRHLTPYQVNQANGQWLHGFRWLDDDEIGELPADWNHLVLVDDHRLDPRAVHFTTGVPSMPGYENSPFADEWRSYL